MGSPYWMLDLGREYNSPTRDRDAHHFFRCLYFTLAPGTKIWKTHQSRRSMDLRNCDPHRDCSRPRQSLLKLLQPRNVWVSCLPRPCDDSNLLFTQTDPPSQTPA